MAKVYVTRQIPWAGIDLLAEKYDVEVSPHDRPLTREELLAAVADADAVLTLLTDRIDAEVFDAAPKAKGFANYAVGYNNMDVVEATKRRIPLSNTPGVLTDATADMAWALLFSVARRVVESDAHMRSGAWQGWGPLQFLGGDVTGRTLAVIGAGRIGTAMALKSTGFSMKVLYVDEHKNTVLESKLGARKVLLEEALAAADYVSVHVPLLPETTHLFGGDQFAQMKDTAYLINTSRGPVIDEQALVEALQSGEIAGAGLDVYDKEPVAAPGLSDLANVVMTPHIASATTQTRDDMSTLAAKNIIAMIEGTKPPTCVNPEVQA